MIIRPNGALESLQIWLQKPSANAVIAYSPGFPAIDWQGSNPTHPMDEASAIFSMFNLIGCPLLLACMCIERYLAVVRPVLYLRVRKWEYRMVVSAVVWVLTLFFCLATGKCYFSIETLYSFPSNSSQHGITMKFHCWISCVQKINYNLPARRQKYRYEREWVKPQQIHHKMANSFWGYRVLL